MYNTAVEDSSIVLSIIIPTLNEELYIGRTLTKIRDHASMQIPYEIIVVDSGSEDGTQSSVAEHAVSFVSKPTFKGLKFKALNHGASLARGEILLFLDADCIVPDHFDIQLVKILEDLSVVGGAFEYRSEDRSYLMRIIEKANHIRYRLNKDYFGDQGVFCRKGTFDQIGGFPERPLMEAAYFCRQLKQKGRLRLIKKDLTTSARRFNAGGILKVMCKDAWIWIQFWLGLDISKYASTYWSENEKYDKNEKS